MFANRKSMKHMKPTAVIVSLMLIFVMLASACTLDQVGNKVPAAAQAGGVRAWLDQPGSDATLPLAPFKLKAHAALEGGGVSQIVFLANSIPVGSVPTDGSQDLVYATYDWNPSEPGEYDIQAKAISAGGEALSGVAQICIASDTAAEGACAVKEQPPITITVTVSPTPTDTPTPVKDVTVNPSAAPDPVYYGICLKREPQSLVIKAKPGDVTDLLEVLARAWVESHNGSRDELPRQSLQKDADGGYSATFDLSKIDQKMMEGQPGRVVYTIALVNKNKETLVTTPEQSVKFLPCAATPTPVVKVEFKLSPTPDPVYIGSCLNKEPQIVTFDGYLSDTSAVAKALVKVDIVNAAGKQTHLFDQAMIKSGDRYTANISVKDVDPNLLGEQAGKLIFVMSLINDVGETYATSYAAAIRVLPCILTPVPEQPSSQDTTPPTIRGGGPSSGTAYFDPKGLDPKGCQPTNVSAQVTVKDASSLNAVNIYWYWASAGPGSAQSAPMAGRGSTFAFTFTPSKGDDKLLYYIRAADIYNNVAQSGTFSFAVVSCKKRTILKPIIMPTLELQIKPPIKIPQIK